MFAGKQHPVAAAAADVDDWLSVGASFVPEPPRSHRRRDASRDSDAESSALQVCRASDSKRSGKEKKNKNKKSSSRKRTRSATGSASNASNSDSGDQQQLVHYKERHLKKQKKSKSKKKKSASRRRHSSSSDSDSGDGSIRRKDRKRLRSGGEEQFSAYSQAVVASAPREVQEWMKQQTVDEALDTMNGSSKFFEFDCAGDRENRFYGTLYAQDKPLYTLATRRNVFTGAWLIERRTTTNPSQQQLSGDPRQVQERSSNRYFGVSARQMERDARQQRLYLAYSEKRLARQRGNTAELAYIPLDPVLEPSAAQGGDDGDEEALSTLRTETANVEQYLVKRSKLFNEALKKSPQDIATWLDFVAFQEQALRLTRPSKTSSSSLSAMVISKQTAILQKAVEANQDNRELQLVKLKFAMRDLNTVGDVEDSMMARGGHEIQLETMITKDLTNGDLWGQLVITRQQNFASFSVPLMRELYARIIAILRKEMAKLVHDELEKFKARGTTERSSSVQIFDSGSLLAVSQSTISIDSVIATSEDAQKLVGLLLNFHLRLCSLEQKAGFTERAIAQLQALIGFNSLDTTNASSLGFEGLTSEHHHADMLRAFTARWDQNLPHFGDDTQDLATASSFSIENAYLPSSDAFARLIHDSVSSQLSGMNLTEAIQSPEHRQSLLRLAGIHQRAKVHSSSSLEPQDGDEPHDESFDDDEAALTYSNVHGYRIKIDEIDDASEYERILGELRGTDASLAKQQSQSKKKEIRELKFAKSVATFHDERADFEPVDADHDAFCQWLRREQAQEMTQWRPLRSTNPKHHEEIDEAPDRAVLTEEIQPYLFEVPRFMRFKLVLNLLKLVGLQWLNPNDKRAHDDENLYADRVEDDYEELMAPILSAMDPSSTESILLTILQRRNLLQQTLLDDVRVSKSALVDASRVAFIRNVFVRFLDALHSQGNRESLRLVKYLWIAFEAQLVSCREMGDNAGLQHARQLCQKLMESGVPATSSHSPSPSADIPLMFAYAKLELRAGNARQLNRICDKTLQSLALHSSSDAKMDRSFHALLFLRARSEIWHELQADEELRKLKTLYILWSAWQQQHENGCDSLEKLEKQLGKHSAKIRSHLQSLLSVLKTTVVEKYRLELEIAIEQLLKQSKRGDLLSIKQSDWFSTVGYCTHNLCLAIYATSGFQAAFSEYQSQIQQHDRFRDDRWIRVCFLEFIQQHQLSSTFPIVAPRDWRLAVGDAVERFPHDPLLLRFFVDAETSNTMSQSLRRHFQSVRRRWQRHFDSPLAVEWLFALLSEFSRLKRSVDLGKVACESNLSLSATPEPPRCCLFHRFGSNLTGVERIRRLFQEMVASVRTQGNALCWRLYVRFEVQMGKVDNARRVFYRGMAKCPWSKALYLDGARVLRPYLSEIECKELVNFMAAKELHVRVEEDEEDQDQDN